MREREVFSLHYYQDLRHAEIAELLNVDERTVKRIYARAKVQLSQLLKGHDGNP